jgi:hypothetical protein
VVARVLALAIYLAALVAAVLLFNANAENGTVAWAFWLAASALLGLGVGRWETAFLPLIAIPIAIPFDYADEYLGSDSPLVWWFAIFVGVQSALLVALGTALRRWYDRRRGQRTSQSMAAGQ